MRGGYRFPALLIVALGVFSGMHAAGPSPQVVPQAAPVSDDSATARALLDRYCVSCHSDRTKTAGLSLQTIGVDRIGTVAADVAAWETVVRRLRARTMPPVDHPHPSSGEYDRLATFLEASLDRAAAASPDPGRAIVHRLNRAEYVNAIRDVLALDIDGAALLPPDDTGYGFDNIADVLSLSPSLLERYLIAATRVSRLALGDPAAPPIVQTYSVRPTLLQRDRMSEELPFGSRGGLAVSHQFPSDGHYSIRIRLQRTHAHQIRGLTEPNDIEVRLDRAKVATFKVGGDGERGPWLAVPEPSVYELTADEGLELQLDVKAGPHLIAVDFPQRGAIPEGVLIPKLSAASYEFAGDRDAPMALDSITITGPSNPRRPVDTPSRHRVLVCSPKTAAAEEACAANNLSAVARRAFRRPVRKEDVDALLVFYREGRTAGDFESGIERALRAVLVDPEFLFRIEHTPDSARPGVAYRVSDVELASRLSFFLWSSVPDDTLLSLAERGTLSQPKVLADQLRRMTADSRADALVTNFAGQWLHLRNMKSVAPDPDAFPEFDENLRDAFQRETELFVRSQIRDDRSVSDLLTADYTFMNERLARHYGTPDVYGNQFRKVSLAATERRGLLGQGSILTVTSYPNRTSPTLRGKWVLENLIGAPPPPPPANVPDLASVDPHQPRSVRERLEQHRENPVCASCHAQMDPIGLALEPFDAVGKRRTLDAGSPIDATSTLPDGTTLTGPSSVRDLLSSRRDAFARTVVEKLLTYALGRGLDAHDAPAVRRIVRTSAPANYRWSSLIAGIVDSIPFQMRKPDEP